VIDEVELQGAFVITEEIQGEFVIDHEIDGVINFD
jgi:hypothetical protein